MLTDPMCENQTEELFYSQLYANAETEGAVGGSFFFEIIFFNYQDYF